MNRNLLIIFLLLLPFSIISYFKSYPIPNHEKLNITVRLKIAETAEIVEMPLEEYLVGVLAAEMPAAFHDEALKAQAIASRTYALSKLSSINDYDLIDTIENQAYIDIEQMKVKWGEDFDQNFNKVKEAVKKTENQIVTYKNQIVTTYYFAMSNGYTENASLVFKEEQPYLISVESGWDNKELNNFEVETTMTKLSFCHKLEITCSNLTINIDERSDTNRVGKMTINSKIYSGTDFRKLMQIRSTDFDIEIKDNNVIIITRGYGHGVGMSQYGANGMAKEGYDYSQILNHYYQNTQITDLNNV